MGILQQHINVLVHILSNSFTFITVYEYVIILRARSGSCEDLYILRQNTVKSGVGQALLAACFKLISSLAYFSTLKMEAFT
jgi:hypothetical protein